MKRSLNAMLNTYILTNMAPQHAGFNRKTMKWTEEFIRGWAKQRKEIWIITGSIFDEDSDGENDQTPPTNFTKENKRVAVPTHFYKVLLWKDKTSGFIDSLAIILKHTEEGHDKWDTDDHLEENITTIEDIEKRIGHDLLPGLPDVKEDALEAVKAEALLNIEGRK